MHRLHLIQPCLVAFAVFGRCKNRSKPGQAHLAERLTVLREIDIERCFWDFGYADVYRRISRLPERKLRQFSPGKVIQAAVRKQSKPFLALSIVEAVGKKGSPGIPPILEKLVRTCVDQARNAPERLAGDYNP